MQISPKIIFPMQIIDEKDPSAAETAYKILLAGDVFAFATDTVYGLAADASNPEAINKIYQLKKRDFSKPIAIFAKDVESAKKIFIFDKKSEEISAKYLPGPLTMVLRTNENAAKILAKNLNNNGDDFIGFRVVANPFLKNLFEKFSGFLAVTSANISGQNAAKTSSEVIEQIPEIELIIDGKITHGIASTVVKIDNEKINVIRKGPIEL